MSEAQYDPPPPAENSDAAPPGYAPSQPQILVTPLPDSPSFFWGRTVQGEVFVKGLGEARRTGGVKSLIVQLHLNDILPSHPSTSLHSFPPIHLYPPPSPHPSTSSTLNVEVPIPFPTAHRFSIPLPASLSSAPSSSYLPGTLNLSSSHRGEVRWSLDVSLTLASGGTTTETVLVEGTPQDTSDIPDSPHEVERTLEQYGVRARVLVDDDAPRLGALLRLGVEVKVKEREKTGGLSSQPDPAKILRRLRRVRVELFRRVHILSASTEPSTAGSSDIASASSPTSPGGTSKSLLTLLYQSGKVMRYPGSSRSHPPLRVLFTLPTVQLGATADQTWGEVSMATPYHKVEFFVRVGVGFGGGEGQDAGDWILEQSITIRPKVWKEPREIVIERGLVPALGTDGEGVGGLSAGEAMTDEQLAREAYRQKGLDTVGNQGTYRAAQEGEMPPAWDAGPSHSDLHNLAAHGHPPPADAEAGGLPSFLESEAQMANGEAPLVRERVMSERLVPVNFDDGDLTVPTAEDRATTVGRRGSLGGELGNWVEYDGYETFSTPPPTVSASYGASGSMDPPQPDDDDDANVVGGMVARLGLEGAQNVDSMSLINQLGLGEGTRVVDMQDDMPPGIDEPSLPALPSFTSSPSIRSYSRSSSLPRGESPHPSQPLHPHQQRGALNAGTHEHDISPPSFAASEAAQAFGITATSHARSPGPRRTSNAIPPPSLTPVNAEDPPGYFPRDGVPSTPSQPHGRNGGHGPPNAGGPPAYS